MTVLLLCHLPGFKGINKQQNFNVDSFHIATRMTCIFSLKKLWFIRMVNDKTKLFKLNFNLFEKVCVPLPCLLLQDTHLSTKLYDLTYSCYYAQSPFIFFISFWNLVLKYMSVNTGFSPAMQSKKSIKNFTFSPSMKRCFSARLRTSSGASASLRDSY